MTFIEKFEEIKAVLGVDVKFEKDFAIQVRLTDEDCGGIFYIEHRNGNFNVEPYDYRDRDAEIVCESKTFASVLQGKKVLKTALKAGFEINGDEGAVVELMKIAELMKKEREAEKARKAEEKAKKEAEKAKKAEEKAKAEAEKAKKAEEKSVKAEKVQESEKNVVAEEKKEAVVETAVTEKPVKKTGNSKKARKAKKAAKREAKQMKMNI